MRDVVAKTRLSQTAVRRLVRAGDFPQPFDLSPKRIAFWAHQIDEWMERRAAAGRKVKVMPDPAAAGRIGARTKRS
jgi:predicted DNA-binding transcriptional regulator AlpA